MRPGRKTQFLTCIEVYTVGDYFAMTALSKIALDTLQADFDSKIGPMQLTYEPIDYLDELLEALQLVYQHVPFTDTNCSSSDTGSALRSAFLNFVFPARFFFLNNAKFAAFLDSAPVFALDLFRAMRGAADFAAQVPEPHCSSCRSKPTRTEKGYYTHLSPEKLRLVACCSNCASKKELLSPTEDWAGKRLTSTERC